MTATFDIAAFRVAFPAFADMTAYPDATLQGYWDTAICIINPNGGCRLKGYCLERALWLCVAHIASGTDATGQVTSASVGGVSVSMQALQTKSEFSYWLSLTPYGLQLLALLRAKSAGGFYFGGLPEGAAFRKFGGLF